MNPPLRFTILGQAVSKANSRRIVPMGDGRVRSIKSAEALKFASDARRQIPSALRVRMTGPVAVVLHMYYATERPDLDESIVLDAMQDHYAFRKVSGDRVLRVLVQSGIYVNDRQVRWKLVVHHIDRKNPRVEVQVASIAPTQDMFALMPQDEPLPF